MSCVMWEGGTNGRGYGRVGYRLKGRQPLAHVAAWERTHGPVPPGMQVHHKCGARLCVNPAHLELVTPDQHAALHVQSSRRTHCVRGHPLTPDNRAKNGRTPAGTVKWCCRACKAERR